MSAPATLAPSERLRVALAVNLEQRLIPMDRAFAEMLLAENATIRAVTADRIAADAIAAARPLNDRTVALLREVRREMAIAVGIWAMNIIVMLLNLWVAGWFG